MKNFISMGNVKKEELEQLLSLADELKSKTFGFNGRTAALLFNRPSTRTLVSFKAALDQMGYPSVYLDYVFTQLVRGEALNDTSRALSKYLALVIARLHPHSLLSEIAEYSEIPVINAGSDLEHPCQALGDIYTLKELGKLKKGKNIVFLGDPQNPVANSLMLSATKLGLKFTFLCPDRYSPLDDYLKQGKKSGEVEITNDKLAVSDADVVYVNSWVKKSLEDDDPGRKKDFLAYQLNKQLLENAPKHAIVMHPLPAFRGVEITSEVLDSRQCVAWKQAENRLYVQKALIKTLMES